MIKIQVNKEDVKVIMSAIGKLKNELSGVDNNLVKKSADGFAQELRYNIVNQVFGDFGEPHSAKWEQFKQKHNLHPGEYWIAFGRLLKSIRSIKRKNGTYEVGIAYYPGRKDPRKYGPILEERRPLFLSTFHYYRKEWNENCKKTFQRIRECWK
ncbi:MAG: hypothetical protein LLG05_09590 [Porphyromonadaceae bacterium]|nr:hypothetical protein [Porphyromonadaceae bacterium]